MGLRHWLKSHLLGSETHEGKDAPPSAALARTALNRERPRVRSLGEYDATSYPEELAELLRRREEVAAELLRVDVVDRQARIDAIPRLRELLRKYPHPLVYEMLIHGYLDAERYEEAKGVAFAARERRAECARSPYPEIRGEVSSLKEWSPAEIDALRAERGSRE